MISPLTLLALALSTQAITVSDCGKGATAFKLGPMSVTPSTPVAGDNITLLYQYTVPAGMVVTDGTSKYSVTYNFIPFSPTIEPLCKNIPCPLSSGTYTNSSTTTWPPGFSGTLTSQIAWQDQNSKPLLCISISGKISSSQRQKRI